MSKIAIPFIAKSFFAYQQFSHNRKNILLTFADTESALKAYRQLQFIASNPAHEILYFPSLYTVPYDRISPHNDILSTRARVLSTLSNDTSAKIIVTAAENLLLKLPPKEIFSKNSLTLKPGMKNTLEEIATFLINNGFKKISSAIESGEFAIRGEIIDIVTNQEKGYRIYFGWDNIETIKQYNLQTQISTRKIAELHLTSASEIFLNSDTITNFKNNFLKLFGVNHVASPVYKSITSGQKFQGYEHLMPLFYNKMITLDEYLSEHNIIYDNLALQATLEYEHSYHDFYQSRILSNKVNPESFYFALPPDNFIIDSNQLKEKFENNNNIFIVGGNSNDITALDKIATTATLEKKSNFDQLFNVITKHKTKIPVILATTKSGIERIKTIADSREFLTNEIKKLTEAKRNFINLSIAPLSGGFITEKYLFISEQDILGDKFSTLSHKSSKKKLKNILTELDNINENELIVHKEHGIGRFECIETIIVDDIAHDCLKLIYQDNDILYLPVENADVIKKYGSDDAPLDKLGGTNWQKRKAKLKNRIKDIADKLIKISAKRSLVKTNPIDFDIENYNQFCDRFLYNETEDQLSSINDVSEDLKSGKLMDRLICGDVGFGKTEVAMRAAFMVATAINEDMPQVAIISPTTILAKQHYKEFISRFKGCNVTIAQFSRLVNKSQSDENRKDLKNGKINIVIGTHKLLSKNIEFKNLKLLIIDEEQHFGVTQKERLKDIKSDVHVLSLSATPIPRTLQMSMSGIKELSLIATPPIDRLPVRTTVMPFDSVIIRDALMRERFRGGRSFFVCPRIKDLEWASKKLTEIVPELTFKIAHGQMTPTIIDKIMSEFYDGKFDILLSTTIIESGIDIATANTIIIHRSEMLGLSQLYQLRGRVGRGKVRGYAYLTMNPLTNTTRNSMQRLEILQNIDSLGAGFTIAGHDMDLRGFGNLVGQEQSGHIKEVGAELYQEMLDNAIEELKNQGKADVSDFTPNINLGMPIFIPSSYIENSALRLAIYRRISDLKSHTEIEAFRDEMVDRFGTLPKEFNNLLDIVEIKNKCFKLGIENLDSGPKGFVLKFNEQSQVSDMVMSFIKTYPRQAKIKPDHKLVFLKKLYDPATIIANTTELLSLIASHC